MSMKADKPSPIAIVGVVILVIVVSIGGFLMLRSASRGDLEGVQLHPMPFSPPAGYHPGGMHGATAPKSPPNQ
jgi:hypothetical protein